jgi:PAS domain S-box-containing protein
MPKDILKNEYPSVMPNKLNDSPPIESPLGDDELFRLMVESVKDYAIFMTDRDGRIVSWNPGVWRLMGYEEEEFVGLPISIIFTPEDVEQNAHQKEMETAAAKGRAEDERWHVRKDGTRFWASGLIMPLRDESDDLRGYVKIMRDVTERRRAQKALREVEQEAVKKYAQLLDRVASLAQALGTARDLMTIFRALRDFALASVPCNGIFISLYESERDARSPIYAWCEGEEVDLSELPPMPMSNSPHSRAVATGQIIVADDFQAAMAGQPVLHVGLDRDSRLPRSSLAAPMIVMGRTVGGFEVQSLELAAYTQEHVAAMRMAANLSAIAIENLQLFKLEKEARAMAEDAERRSTFLAEASTLLSASLDYHTTLENLTRLVVPHLADWCVIDMPDENGGLKRVAIAHTDSSKEELARQMSNRYPYDLRGEHPIVKAFRTGQPTLVAEVTDEMLTAAYPVAEQREFVRELGLKSCMIVPLIARGRPISVITFVIAETERRYTEADLAFAEDLARRAATAVDNARLYGEAEQANRLKDEFLATLSHELRTPLTAILGWSRLLLAGSLDESDGGRALEAIERNAQSQKQLIDDILDVSRIITGKLHLHRQSVNLVPVIEAAVDSIRPAADAKNIEIRLHLTPQTGIVSGDPNRLQQVIWNLLSNAIKFTPEHGRVEVRLERSGSSAQIKVSDTGRGISQDFLPYVFDRFRQADQTTTRSHGGLGLGLSVVRHLVELHGGMVKVESGGEGEGATFTVDLPLVALATNRDVKMPAQEGLKHTDLDCSSGLEGLHVLVIDDDAGTLELLSTVLKKCGADVTAVASGAQALEALAQTKPDLLISDIGMPDMDGYALIRRVRTFLPESGGGIPAVALTAYAGAEDRRRALHAGFQVYLAKPFETNELIATVARLAERNGEV